MLSQVKPKFEEDLKPISPKHLAIKRIAIGMFNFWITTCAFLFFFFGALQQKFQYPSTLIQDVNKTLGTAGSITVGIFLREGAKKPTFWIIMFMMLLKKIGVV